MKPRPEKPQTRRVEVKNAADPMATRKLPIMDQPSGISFKLRVQPKSSRNQIAGAQGDAIKLKVTAPPAEGAANRACLELLSKALDVPKSCLEITSGQSSRAKTIFVRCDRAVASRIRRRLEELATA